MKSFFSQTVAVVFIVNCIIGLWSVDVPMGRIWSSGTESSLIWWLYSIGLGFTLFSVAYLLLQAVLAGFYRPHKAPEDDSGLPSCTVLIPAFNEGAQVFDTIESVLQSDYPAEKMEILSIDDGSQDDTWEWICRAVQKYPGRVRGLQQAKNGGKKRALCRGIAESRNEIIVTVDSDSILEKCALKNLLCPFPQDKRIGGVAGNIRVRNYQQCGMLRKMLDVAFVFGCDFMRSAQSVIGSVLCTPGAISAYRRSAVLPVVQEWLDQTFLGAPSTIGEDRALTSLLLRSGYQVICQNNAVAWTEVPQTYSKLCKMLLRWTRGDVRECILLLNHVCSRWSFKDWRWTLFQLNIFSQLIGVMLPVIFIPCTILTFFLFRDQWGCLLYYTISFNGIWSLLPAVVYMRRTSFSGLFWALVYGIFNLVALSWICIYSLMTLRNSKWLTRNIKQA